MANNFKSKSNGPAIDFDEIYDSEEKATLPDGEHTFEITGPWSYTEGNPALGGGGYKLPLKIVGSSDTKAIGMDWALSFFKLDQKGGHDQRRFKGLVRAAFQPSSQAEFGKAAKALTEGEGVGSRFLCTTERKVSQKGNPFYDFRDFYPAEEEG